MRPARPRKPSAPRQRREVLSLRCVRAADLEGTISTHGSSTRRASTSSASSAAGTRPPSGGGGGGGDGEAPMPRRGNQPHPNGRASTRRSPSKKPTTAVSSPDTVASPNRTTPTTTPPLATNATSPATLADETAFNPLVAMQTVLAGDLVPIKQRSKAAQQLATYFCELPTTPSLYAYYEPYLPIVASVVVAPIKAAKDIQENVIKMLKALASHSPRQFVEWCALHVSMDPTQPPWYVDWCGGLLLAAETRVPRVSIHDGNLDSGAEMAVMWDERSIEFQELDAATASVFHVWRSVLDNADDEEIVYEIATGMKTLLCYEPSTSEHAWRALVTSKIQPHFVDMTDVLIGWAMSTSTPKRLREAIFALLEDMRELWMGNNVFCLQLLESFSSDIGAIYASPSASSEDFGRLDSIILCSTLVAQFIPVPALASRSGQLGFVETLLCSSDLVRFYYSCDTVLRLSEYFDVLASGHSKRFAQLSMRAVRFLVGQIAYQIMNKRCDTHTAVAVLEKASGFATLLSEYRSDYDSRLHTKALFTDTVVFGGGKQTEHSVLEALLSLNSFAAAKYSTQIIIKIALFTGMEGLQLIAATLEKNISASEDAIISPWATCFILVCNNPQFPRPTQDICATKKTLELFLSLVRRVSTTTQALHVISCVLKVVPVFVALLKRWSVPDLTTPVCELIHVHAELSILLLRAHDSDPTIVRDVLGSLYWSISSHPSDASLSLGLQTSIIEQLQLLRACDRVSVRTECIKLLSAIAPVVSDRAVSFQVFTMASEMMSDCEESERIVLIKRVLPFLSPSALLVSKKQPLPSAKSSLMSWKRVWVPSEMLVGDFERVYDLLTHPETTSDAWYRTSRRIHARMRLDQHDPAYDPMVLMRVVVREAAKWIVQNRLRSPLGPPSAIFSGVEKMLHVHANHHIVGRGALGHEYQDAVSSALLVDFVMAMEVLLGSATDLKCPESNPESDLHKIQTFFRANVAVCEEWLSRIRPALVELASRLKQSESLMHHSNATVAALARKLEAALQRNPSPNQPDEAHVRVMKCTIDLESALFTFAKSLCGLGDSDSILGIQAWWGDLLSRMTTFQAPSASEWEQRLMLSNASSSWLLALAYQAELKYEDAVQLYEAILNRTMSYQVPPQASPELLLHPLLSPIGLSLTAFVGCMRECGKCLATLRRWGQLRDLSGRCQAFASMLSDKWGRTPALTGLFELCEAWSSEDPLTYSLHQLDSTFEGLPHSDSSFVKEEKMGARAAAILQNWGALSIADRLSASSSRTVDLENVHRVAGWLQSLRFRPADTFPDTLSPTSSIVQESTLLLSSLLGDGGPDDRLQLLRRHQLVVGDVGDYLLDSTKWSRLFMSHDNLHFVSPELWLALARAARKQKNYGFAAMVLKRLHGQAIADQSEDSRVVLLYENAVLNMAGEACHDGVLTLVHLCESVLEKKSSVRDGMFSDTVHVRALLRLARTLAGVTTGDDFGSVEAAMSVMGSRIEKSTSSGLVEYRDNLVMVCLESATEVAPTNPQTWYEFSKWCHQQGRQSIDKVVADGGQLELIPSEEEALELLLKDLQSVDASVEKENIRAIFKRVMDGGSLLSNREERLRRALSAVASATTGQSLVDQFVSLQSLVVSRLLRPIKDAATGYRSFLLTVNLQKDTTTKRDSSRITSVALRLLRMLTRFGSESEVVNTVTDVFASGPLAPWGRIVPQLLSRIGHSYSDVSNPVAALLVRLARRYPHLVVYPAVVEAGRKQDTQDVGMVGKKLLNDVLFELRTCAPDLLEGVRRMVDELKRISILWDDAWIFALVKMSGDVNRRISTLDKEAHRVDKNSSLSAIEKDQLARRKAVAIMTPVLVAVERLWMDTLGQAVPGSTLTPHEKQFVHKYGSTISTAIQVFRGYCSIATVATDSQTTLESTQAAGASLSPSEVWQPFADLLKALASAVGRRERVDLVEISPMLARTSHKSKAALMPGTFSSESYDLSGSDMITVTEVSRNVAILRTKTKPKCLKFVGSDGQTHRYLLKAREDLHLDERIMQFLETVNEFLRADRASNMRNLRACNYSVVPLSSDAGLIQIVPDVLPLFQIYTSRMDDSGEGVSISGPAAAAAAALDPEETNLPLLQPPTAPFYAKLKQFGIQDVTPTQRSRWPLATLRRVHEDLVSTRPMNVISREIAAQSEDFADAWAKRYRFSRSTAVTSVLGYLVGLGDRHLDNMLMCATTGELLHIDYNVCFDKGRKLKVPEVVPFRLTPIMVDGLGLTGVEGVYRSAFVNTLRVVRDPDSREALLALLDAFVYDPLVDWVSDGKNHAISRDTKRRMDVNVNLSLFLSRARERSQETTHFVTELNDSLRSVGANLTQTVAWVGNEIMTDSQQLRQASEGKKLADEAVHRRDQECTEISSNHPQDEAAMAELLQLLEGDKVRVASFVRQCYERHQHIKQIQLRLSKYVPGAAIRFGLGLQAQTGGNLARAHARIVTIARDLPLSPSTSVWMNMLANLETRCAILDQQIPAIIEECDLVVGKVSPMLQEYAVYRARERSRLEEPGQLGETPNDVYGIWCGWCTKLLDALDKSNLDTVHDFAGSIMSQLESFSTNDCSRQRHTTLVTELQEEFDRLHSLELTEPHTSADIETRVQEFLNSLSALKLSNSQTQRMVKLINTRWILSSLCHLEETMGTTTDDYLPPGASLRMHSLMRSVYSVSHAATIVRSLASTAKGSIKKTILEMLENESRTASGNDWTQSALDCICAIIDTLESIFSTSIDEMTHRLYNVRNDVSDDFLGNGLHPTDTIDELFSALAGSVESLYASNQFGLSSDIVAEVHAFQVEVRQLMTSSSNLSSGQELLADTKRLSASVATFASLSVAPALRELLRKIVSEEWNISIDMSNLDVTQVDSLALDAMPALGSSVESPLAGFHECCETFDRLWTVWSYRSAELVNLDEQQRRLRTLKKLLDTHQRHVESFDWAHSPASEACQVQTGRSRLLHQIALLAPTLPRMYEEMARVESNLLEVAQQLEYVASQISFNCAMGTSANEVELQAICRDVQDLYNQTSRHFEVTREMSEMALGVNTVETSLRRICGETAPSSLEVEVNQVGRKLLEETTEHVEEYKSVHDRSDSSMTSLNKQLGAARDAASQANADVMTQQESFAAACRSLEPTDVCSRVAVLVQHACSLAELLQSVGVHDGPAGTEENPRLPAKKVVSSRKTNELPKFALTENERLMKILHRSVEQISSMQELSEVLEKHDQAYQQLQTEASSLTTALSSFCASALTALNAQDIPGCILAVEELKVACGGGGTRDVFDAASALLESCCERFFDASRLADELTKAEDLAPNFDGGQDHSENDQDGSDDNDDEALDLMNEDAGDVVDVPLRPLAGFQEQNRYGVDVVARIDEKLGGIVVESGSRDPLSVEDQSSWLIRAATNVDNLCVMYEGWTPWI